MFWLLTERNYRLLDLYGYDAKKMSVIIDNIWAEILINANVENNQKALIKKHLFK